MRVGLGKTGQPHQLQVFPYQPFILAGRPAIQTEGDILFHRQPGEQAVLLEDHPPVEPRSGNLPVTEPDRSRRNRFPVRR